jgi:hypothetical protein
MTLQATVALSNDNFVATLSDGRSFQQAGFREMADILHRAGVAADIIQYEWCAGQRMITAGQKVALSAAIRHQACQNSSAGLSDPEIRAPASAGVLRGAND